jgi:hypothetical protein
MIVGTAWAGFRLRPRLRQDFGSLSGAAMLPLIIAAELLSKPVPIRANRVRVGSLHLPLRCCRITDCAA